MSKMMLTVLVVSILLCCNVEAGNMKTKELQQKEHFKKDVVISADLKYLLYLPKDYNLSGKSFPLIVFLHGAGERGDNLDLIKVHGIPKRLETDSGRIMLNSSRRSSMMSKANTTLTNRGFILPV